MNKFILVPQTFECSIINLKKCKSIILYVEFDSNDYESICFSRFYLKVDSEVYSIGSDSTRVHPKNAPAGKIYERSWDQLHILARDYINQFYRDLTDDDIKSIDLVGLLWNFRENPKYYSLVRLADGC